MDEAYFRAAYEADAANKGRQPWADYLGWVRAFYEGKRFPPVPGWAARERDLATRLRPDARIAVLARAAETGRRIAAEWAKDNAVRRVSTDDLRSFGGALDQAAKADAGDGARILAALAAIERRLPS